MGEGNDGSAGVSSLSREELEERAVALQTVLNVLEAVHHARDFSDFAERAVEAVTRFTRFPSVGLFLLEPELGRVRRLAIRGFGPDVTEATRTLPLEGSLTGHAVRTKTIAVSTTIPSDARVETRTRAALGHEGYACAACVPLLFHDDVVGTINLIFRDAQDLDPQERRTLLAIGRTIAGEMSHRLAEQERRALAEQAQRGRQLESLGVLAGGLAHDFNNLLVGILGSISLARDDLRQNDAERVEALLAQAEKASLRARDLVRQLLTLARGGAPLPAPTADVGAIVRDAAEFAVHGAGVRLAARIAGDVGPVEVDASQLAQVVQNLVMNAAQASPAGGEVRVDLAAHERDGVVELTLVVEDDGAGMSEDTRAKIFDPYFTTRKDGSGLGLTTAHSIVRRHGGRIDVQSRPGAGARFTVVLPVRRTAAPVAAPHADDDVRGVRVLVVDDEPGVRKAACAMLRRIGADVELAADGDEAAAATKKALADGRPFRVVVLDLTLVRGPQGTTIWRSLRALDPSLRAIASSGYATDGAMASPDEHGFAAVLPKPYGLAALRAAIAAALRASG